MAVLGRGLDAEQHCRHAEDASVQPVLYSSFGQQSQITALVVGPTGESLSEAAHQLEGGAKEGFGDVVRATQLLQEKREIASFGEASKLRRVGDPNVDAAFDTALPKCPEEPGRRFLAEADRVDVQNVSLGRNALSLLVVIMEAGAR